MKNIDSINPNSANNSPKVVIMQNPPKIQPSGVNLLTVKAKKSPKRLLKKILLAIILVILALGTGVIIRAANLSQKIFVGQKTTFWSKVIDVIRGTSGETKLVGEDSGQINILLLGIGGEGHDGPYLTDTMILAQLRPDIGEVTLTSIPRDYWANMPNGSQAKINEAFSDGYLKNHDWDQGGQWARETVQNLTGLEVPYFAVMDFSGFEKAIDQVGGVDVTVDRSFTDYQYPDNGTGYLPPQTFVAGPQHMDGATALIFARSRHAAGVEGSDFARSQRQQKIIEAFKQKVISNNLVSDAGNINQLLGIFADHFHTNISPAEIFHVYGLVKDKNMSVLSLSLDPDTNLICPEILASTGAYVLTPCPGKSNQDIENFFKNSFSAAKIKSEGATVWLATSTGDRDAYQTAFRKLTDAGITVYELGYSKDQLPQTILYQVNNKPSTAEFIANELNATQASLPPPGVTVDKAKVDLIVVLGTNAASEPAPAPYIAPPARVPTTTTSTTASLTSSSTLISTTTPSKK